jgi:hypothetical protein
VSDPGSDPTSSGGGGDLHGRPTAIELVDAVAGFLRDELSPTVEGPFRHQIRIAVHALEVVSRELTLGPEQAAAHRARLEELGVETDAELAEGIRAGRFDDHPGLIEALRADTRDRLLVANPRWLQAERD